MSTAKKILYSFLVALMAFGAVIALPSASKAASATTNNLGDLFVLDALFGNDGSGVLRGNGTDLGDLFILDQLFGGSSSRRITNGSNLGDLIILDQLFDNNSGGLFDLNGTSTSGTSTNSGTNNLGRLFILDRLFGNNNTGLFR